MSTINYKPLKDNTCACYIGQEYLGNFKDPLHDSARVLLKRGYNEDAEITLLNLHAPRDEQPTMTLKQAAEDFQ